MARPTSRKAPARTPDAEFNCHGVAVVTPIGKFTRRPGAVPKRHSFKRQLRGNWTDQATAEEMATAYNRRSLALGWSSWAIVTRSAEGRHYLRALEAARVTVDVRGPEIGLRLYGASLRWRPGEARQLHVDLRCGVVMVDYIPGLDLRAIAIKRVKEVRAAVKAASAS